MKKQLGFFDLFWLTLEEETVPYWVINSLKIAQPFSRKQIEKATFQMLERYPILLSRLIQDKKEFFFEYPENPSAINIQEYIKSEKGSHDEVINKLVRSPYDESREPIFYIHHITSSDSTVLIIRASHVLLDGATSTTLLAILIHNLIETKPYLPEFRFEFLENYIRQITSNVSGIQFPGRFKRYLIGIKEFLYLLFRHPFKPQLFNTTTSNLDKSIYKSIVFDEKFTETMKSIRTQYDIGSNTIINFLILTAYSVVTGEKKLVNVYPKNVRNETSFTLGNLISPNFVSIEYTPQTRVIDKLTSFQEAIKAEVAELENLFVIYLAKMYPSKTLKNAKKEMEKSANGNVHTSNMGRFPPYSIPKDISKKFDKYKLSELKLYVRPKGTMGAVFNILGLQKNFIFSLSYVPELEKTITQIVDLVKIASERLSDNILNSVEELFSQKTNLKGVKL